MMRKGHADCPDDKRTEPQLALFGEGSCGVCFPTGDRERGEVSSGVDGARGPEPVGKMAEVSWSGRCLADFVFQMKGRG